MSKTIIFSEQSFKEKKYTSVKESRGPWSPTQCKLPSPAGREREPVGEERREVSSWSPDYRVDRSEHSQNRLTAKKKKCQCALIYDTDACAKRDRSFPSFFYYKSSCKISHTKTARLYGVLVQTPTRNALNPMVPSSSWQISICPRWGSYIIT